ncbi:MAG: type II secretion system F family protein [Polyangiaceae bacterium]|jgi:general secretion pathway protein F
MAVFEYRGIRTATGKQVHGVRDADNSKSLRALLKREGVLLTSAREEHKARVGDRASGRGLSFFGRVSVEDVSMMTRQMATLVAAGIPLVEAVAALIEQMEKLELKRVLTQIVDRLNEGSSLAKALELHPQVFSKLYVSMVAAGEASGTLEGVLERLADFLESQSKLRGKVGAALAYPALMLVIGSVLVTVMMVVVVPKVTSIFESMDRALPWYTELLIGASHLIASNEMLGFVLALATFSLTRTALRDHKPSEKAKHMLYVVLALGFGALLILGAFSVQSFGLYVLGVVAGVIAGLGLAWLLAWLATPQGRLSKDAFALRVPIFGTLVRMLAVSRFSRTLATLLRSGVPLLKAMEIVKNVLDNAKLEQVIETATGSIREGESIAGPLKRSGDFPPIVTHMIAVGERSGQLEQMLENVARAYDTQVETRVQALTSLLEPLMMVVMGGGVGFIAFAILMPLIQMNEFIQQ